MMVVPCCCQSVPVETIAMPADHRLLVLECAVEVCVGGVPSAVYIDGVAGGQGTS